MAEAKACDVQATLNQINTVLRSNGSHFAEYSCKKVSWDDVQRGTKGGELSCWGANITDTRLWARDGRSLFTVRGDNWNERLGKVGADQIAVVASSDRSEGGGVDQLRPRTLRSVLKNPAAFGGYAGLPDALDLSNDALDREISVRFQTTFLPASAGGGRTAIEFAPEAYNYNTLSDEEPRNLVLLCTTQGLAVQQDGMGAKKLFHHTKVGDGTVARHWLEAESSDHRVGGSQKETEEERADALARGKATSCVIGVAGLGTRFNVLMTIQVPLKPRPPLTLARPALPPVKPNSYPPNATSWYPLHPRRQNIYNNERKLPTGFPHPRSRDTLSSFQACNAPPRDDAFYYGMRRCPDSEMRRSSSGHGMGRSRARHRRVLSTNFPEPHQGGCQGSRESAGMGRSRSSTHAPEDPFGKSSAARVSRGSFEDKWRGLTVKTPERHPSEHITVTIVLYYVCSGGVPTEKDVKAAINDLEDMYTSTEGGRLADETFDFMKSELTVKDALEIEKKLRTQPPPAPGAPVDWNVFPGTE